MAWRIILTQNREVEFDEGHLKNDLVAAEAEIEATMAILSDAQPHILMEHNKLRWIFQLCWERLKKVSSTTYPVIVQVD